jgi:hypothetical protein
MFALASLPVGLGVAVAEEGLGIGLRRPLASWRRRAAKTDARLCG